MNRFLRPNQALHRSARRMMLAVLLMLLAILPLSAAMAATAAGAPGASIAVNKNNKTAVGGDYTAYPTLNASAVAPLVMLVISRDEQLFIKAYTDYTDLDGDGVVDTTYNDKFNYSGYFDSNLCYQYGTATYKASAKATGTNGHQCDGTTWSGNFLNWLTMSRLDVLRLVLYGGLRSTDTSTATTLERAPIPNDLHAWAKVYSGTDINNFTPFTTTMSFCNATFDDNGNYSVSGSPRLRAAKGVFSEWGSTASQQCQWQTGSKPSNGNSNWFDIPNQSSTGGTSYTVRVQVCDPGSSFRESFCQSYNNSGTPSYKPVGLLQRYGENGQMRFGLITGSYGDPRSGGVLRRNIGKLAGNVANTDCGTGDEISLQTGVFCSSALASGAEGIVNALNRFNIVNNIGSWNGTWSDCNTYGINNRTGGNGHLNNPGTTSSYSCEAWGNPLSEMYAEALNYIAGGTSTAAYLPGTDLTGLPSATWFDPYGKDSSGNVRNPYCAQCSIIVLSTGLNSFDGDEVSSVAIPNLGSTVANDSTKTVGTLEGINGTYLVGRSLDNLVATQSATAGPAQTGDASVVGNAANTHEDICTGKTVDNLSLVRGICPDIPSQEGSYLIAGLAYKARITDMRPNLKTASGAAKPSGNPNNIQTYTVALAENLPKFQIPLSNGSFSIVPMCQANNSGSATASSSDWRNCYLGNVTIGTKTSIISPFFVYGRPQLSTGKAGSFSVVWEDSQWGNDHDLDTEVMFTYCVGAQCNLTTTNHGSYTGYDICWLATLSTSSVCGTSGKPTIGEDTALVRIEHLSAYAGNAMLGGFTVTGSDNDGVKRDLLRPGNQDNSILTQSKNIPSTWTVPQVYKFKIGSAQAQALQNPLYYAAKYGGFAATTDANGNAINQPCDSTTTPACSTSNWDRVDNNTGQPTTAGTGDGLPDNFFPVRNPAQLGARLADVFNKILARSGSGTSAAVVSSSAAGEGLTYQALYQAQQQNKDGSQKVAWTGALNALWTDAQGRLRMGGYNVNGVPTLGNYTQNPIVVFCTTTTGESRYQTFTDVASAPSSIAPAQCAGQTLDTLTTVWSAQTQLNAGTYTTATQRTYGTAATPANGRYIFTWVDANHNGKVDAGEQMDFTWTSSTLNGTGTCAGTTFTGNYRFLNTCDATGASALVSWVRGADYVGSDGKPDPNWRSRTLDTQVYRLGDIINSTPLAVGTPAEAFDLLYNDASYGGFRAVYQSRRQMIYVGANDGMLHAFNGGFYDAANKQVDLQPPKCASDGTCTADTGYTAHPLGAEVWAYVPGNLLPHLRWMADPQYTHMFYVDGSPISQDARIFSADTGCAASGTTQCHPDGWGTVLIVPFRFGGGPIGLDTKSGSGATQQNSFSAYVVLDVTNPEAPPVVLAELTNTSATGTTCASTIVSCADLTQLTATYTSSLPAVAMFRPAGTTNPNPSKFYLFTGSGTTDNSGVGTTEGGSAGSSQNLMIRAYDMANLASANPTPVTWGSKSNAADFGNVGSAKAGAQSFAGDLIASDFNLDGIAEALYFGSSQGTSNSFSGGMWAIDFNNSTDPTAWTPRMLVSGVNRPVTIRPTLGVDDQQRSMVFFGTGRAYTKADLGDQQRQIVASIIDSKGTVALSSLIDITNVQITADDKVVGSPKTVANEAAFAQLVATYPGWLYNLSVTDSNGNTVPAERVISSQALAGGVLLTTTYLPGTDTCTDQGQGLLYGMDYKSGTSSTGLLGFLDTTTSGQSTYVARSVSLGAGLPSQPSLHKGGTDANGTQQLRVCVQTSSGAIICHDVTPLQGITSGEISWREPLDK
ncbi:PilC/PilY family type IV pilus protein [Dyella sp. GSA-30]|uniref:pilus assembly protein n=1 Tax=Dyella sp. GSA-30 TaxID=2994496 RepID=UPI0024912ECC|nr:PilC/PilY family type IV pilus protein [Dyella sp. GSA-30]